MRVPLLGGRHGPSEAEHHEHHHRDPIKRIQQVEGLFDVLVVSLIVLLIAAMVWAFLSPAGGAPWMNR